MCDMCIQIVYHLSAIISTILGYHILEATPCDGSPEILTVDYTARKAYSPGYPNHYDNNLECVWVFEALKNQKVGFGIQVATLELDFDPSYVIEDDMECADYLEAFEGAPSNLGNSLGKWCNSKKPSIKSLSSSVTLKFHSNGHYTGKGFVIEYSLIRVSSAECLPGRVTPVHAGRAALYESFEIKDSLQQCTWTMKAIDQNGALDSNSALVIESFHTPLIPCSNGKFVIYDGQDINGTKVLEWCGAGAVFSAMYMSSMFATLTFIFQEGEELDADINALKLKIYSRALTYECNDSSMPSIRADRKPVYFFMPFVKSYKGKVCDVHVFQRDMPNIYFEIENVNGKKPTCNMDVISVKKEKSKDNSEIVCHRRQYPMYLPHENAAIVGWKNSTNKVLLKIVTASSTCGGEIFQKQAFDTSMSEIRLPKLHDSSLLPLINCYTRLFIETRNENRSIVLHLKWSLDILQKRDVSTNDACDGDFVNVYDGKNESDHLLFSSCRLEDMPHDYVKIQLMGTKPYMLVLFNIDEIGNARGINLEYYSVPSNSDLCKDKIIEIPVNRSEQYLTSPNYPFFYPIHYTCHYKLVAAVTGDVIVVEVVNASFPTGCGDIIDLFEGGSIIGAKELFGRICGQDKAKKFLSSGHEAMIRFHSDQHGASGGWKLRLYSQNKVSLACRTPQVSWLIGLIILFTLQNC